MKWLPVLLIAGLAGCAQKEPEVNWSQVYRNNEWVVTETVTFAQTNDPSDIKLEDGRRLSVLYDGRSNWETASNWPKGTELTLAYSRSEGAMLIKADSNFRVVVYDGFDGKHPLDTLHQRNLALDYSTMGMVMAHDANITRWNEEIERLHEFFQRSSYLPPEAKAAMAEEKKAWDAFLAAHSAASSTLYDLPVGSMWRERSLDEHREMIRGHAMRLLMLMDPLSASDIQSWGE
jgi:hypothetical protein